MVPRKYECAIKTEGTYRGGEGTTPETHSLSRSWKSESETKRKKAKKKKAPAPQAASVYLIPRFRGRWGLRLMHARFGGKTKQYVQQPLLKFEMLPADPRESWRVGLYEVTILQNSPQKPYYTNMSDVPRSLRSWVSTIHIFFVVLTPDVFQLFIKQYD